MVTAPFPFFEPETVPPASGRPNLPKATAAR